MPRLTSFTQELQRSMNQAPHDMAMIAHDFGVPIGSVSQATDEEDKKLGVDFWLTSPDGTREGVDVMWRHNAVRYWRGGEPQLAIELMSRLEDGTPSKFAKTGPEPAWYLFAFSELPGIRYILPGPDTRAAFQQGRFTGYPIRTAHTVRDGGEWSTPFYPVNVTAMSVIVGSMFLVGDDERQAA